MFLENKLNGWLNEASIERKKQERRSFQMGDPIESMFFVLEGISAFKVEQNGQYKEMGRVEKGTISGALP